MQTSKTTKFIDFFTTNYPEVQIQSAHTYYWSPSDKTVFYKQGDTSEEGLWALIHECGHALLGHTQYFSDFELVQMEVEAWEKAKEIAEQFERTVAQPPAYCSLLTSKGEDHIQDCLDSYRDWLHKRSLCPDCHLSSIQVNDQTYSCIFCHKRWQVTAERFCRPYRKKL